MREGIRNYLAFELPGRLTPQGVISLLGATFCFTVFSVVVLHAFIPSQQPVPQVLVHAISVALTYTLVLALLMAVLFLLGKTSKRRTLCIWHFWVLSLLVYLAGFYLSSIGGWSADELKYQLHTDLHRGNSTFHLLRLTPVWALITYLFILVVQKRSLEAELGELNRINQGLHPAARPKAAPLTFQSGKKQLEMDAASITHISVDDHYCYIYTETDGSVNKVDVSQPLREIEQLVPENFLQVHRSHIVNLDQVNRIERRDRNVRLLVGEHKGRIPVSRARLKHVLSALDQEKR